MQEKTRSKDSKPKRKKMSGIDAAMRKEKEIMIKFENNEEFSQRDCLDEWSDFCMLRIIEVKSDCQVAAMARNIPPEKACFQINEWFHRAGTLLFEDLFQDRKFENTPYSELKDDIKNIKKERNIRIRRHEIEYGLPIHLREDEE